MSLLPALSDIEQAAESIAGRLPCTPQFRWPLLCEQLGADIWLKHENHSPVGAFKVRGGIVYVADLMHAASPNGLITATRGNHGQSIALAAREYGIPVTVVVPHGNSLEKNSAMRALGATLIEHGHDFQAAREYAQSVADTDSLHMVPSFHPLLVRGVATYALEFFRAVPKLDVVYVPIGLGSGICGTIAVRDGLGIAAEIVGVVSTHAPAYAVSMSAGAVIEVPTRTILGDGMACRTPQPDAFDCIVRSIDRIVEVSDDELSHAMRMIYQCTHNVSEGAGAAAVAAALQEKSKLTGKKVGAILTGGNIDRGLFASVLNETFVFNEVA